MNQSYRRREATGCGHTVVQVLASSLKTFLSLPRNADVRIVVVDPDGRRVEFEIRRADRVEDIEALVRGMLERAG